MVALNYGEIESHPERVSNTFVYDCLFINKYNWNEINYPCKIDAWHGIIGVHSPSPLNLGLPLIPKLQVPLNLSGRTFSYFGSPYQYLYRIP